MMYLPYALELSKQRSHEAERRAREIDMIALATLAGRVAAYRDPDDPRQQDPAGRGPRRPGTIRRFAARRVRALSSATYVLADAVCTVASRIEGSAVH